MLTTDTDGLVLEFRNWRARPSEIFFSGYLFPSCRLLGTGQVDIEQKALIFASDLKKLFAKADSFTLRSEETTDIPLRNFWPIEVGNFAWPFTRNPWLGQKFRLTPVVVAVNIICCPKYWMFKPNAPKRHEQRHTYTPPIFKCSLPNETAAAAWTLRSRTSAGVGGACYSHSTKKIIYSNIRDAQQVRSDAV